MNTLTKRVGLRFICLAGVWAGYLTVALTLAGSYEKALVDAAEELGVPDNRLPAEVVARIFDEHTFESLVGLPILVLAPAVLLFVAIGVRRHWPSSLADWSVGSAAASAAIWWSYLLINAGAYGDPDNLPPLTRDLDVLTVPLVAGSSAFALVSVIAAAEGMRRAGVIRTAARAASVVAGLLLVAGLAGTVLSGFGDPLPPIALVPSSLILGIALLRSSRREQAVDGALSIPAGQRED